MISACYRSVKFLELLRKCEFWLCCLLNPFKNDCSTNVSGSPKHEICSFFRSVHSSAFGVNLTTWGCLLRVYAIVTKATILGSPNYDYRF